MKTDIKAPYQISLIERNDGYSSFNIHKTVFQGETPSDIWLTVFEGYHACSYEFKTVAELKAFAEELLEAAQKLENQK